MAHNKLVIRYLNGSVAKGYTADFLPGRDIFHLVPLDARPGMLAASVYIKECKALFFVKDFTGDARYQDSRLFGQAGPLPGRKIQVLFKDDEVLVGTTLGYDPSRPGFFLYPADEQSNIDRSYVVTQATRQVSFI
jgi:hypothetical protein